MNGSGSGRASPVDADLTFLHGLQQCRLGLRRRPVDLVGQQQVGEHRAGAELELGGAGVVHQRAGDVAGHQVGGELHPLELQLQRRGQRAHQQRLRDARHAFEQHVAAAQQRDHQSADHGVLTDDGLGDLGAQRQQRVRAVSDVAARHPCPIGVCATAASRLCDLPFDVVEFVGEVDQFGVGGRRRTEQRVPDRRGS